MATSKGSGPLDPIIVGVDIGNATTSVATADGRIAAFFPSFVSAVGIAPFQGISRVVTTRHHIGHNGVNAIVGADALDNNIAGDTLLAEYDQSEAYKRYLEPGSLYCFLAGISVAFPDVDMLGIRMATGAPLSIYQAHSDKIKKHYRGEHVYTYNGHQRKIVVSDVQVFGEGLEVLRLLPVGERLGRIAVHDIGGRTWNVALFKDGAIVGGRTYDAGIDRLLGRISSVTNQPGAVWQMQQEMRRSAKAHADVRSDLDRLLNGVLDGIERKVRIDKADRHLLVGGGAVYLSDVIRRRYKTPVQVLNSDAPEMANALAYALAASEAK